MKHAKFKYHTFNKIRNYMKKNQYYNYFFACTYFRRKEYLHET